MKNPKFVNLSVRGCFFFPWNIICLSFLRHIPSSHPQHTELKFVEKKWFKEDKSAKAAAKAAKEDSESDDDGAAVAAAAKKAGKVYTRRFARVLCVYSSHSLIPSCLFERGRSRKKWSMTTMGMFFKVNWKL